MDNGNTVNRGTAFLSVFLLMMLNSLFTVLLVYGFLTVKAVPIKALIFAIIISSWLLLTWQLCSKLNRTYSAMGGLLTKIGDGCLSFSRDEKSFRPFS